MRRLVKDEHKAEEEKKAKLTKLQEDKKRHEYLTAQKDNKLFQRFIMQEIIQDEINSAERISSKFKNLATLVSAPADEVKNMMIINAANIILLNKIKSRINI